MLMLWDDFIPCPEALFNLKFILVWVSCLGLVVETHFTIIVCTLLTDREPIWALSPSLHFVGTNHNTVAERAGPRNSSGWKLTPLRNRTVISLLCWFPALTCLFCLCLCQHREEVGVSKQECVMALLAAAETGDQLKYLHNYGLSCSASLGKSLCYCVPPASHP